MAPRGNHLSGSGARHRGLQLVPSLHINMRSTVNTIVETVGSKADHAAAVHQGSSPHTIRGGGKLLKFQWERGNLLLAARASGRISGSGPSRRLRRRGGFFYFLTVRHPGNKRPVRYLTTPMHMFGRLNGFRTTSTGVSRSPLP